MNVSNQHETSAAAMNWFIKVRDTVYGPYSLSRMQHFAAEGRVSTRTLVSDNRDDGFGPAVGDPVLAEMLNGNQTSSAPAARIHASAHLPRVFAAYATLESIHPDIFAEQLSEFGEVIRPFANVWLIKGDTGVEALRNTLTRRLGAGDHLVVFEVSEDRGAWFNIGQEADRQIREFFGGGSN